jgi:hypothetical protein
MGLDVILAAAGTLGGLMYAGLGIAALKHMNTPSSGDRAYGWTLGGSWNEDDTARAAGAFARQADSYC